MDSGRRLYPALPWSCAALPSLHHVPVSLSALDGVLSPPPVVACEGRADGDAFEDRVSADEVHSDWQVVGSHSLQLRGAEARTALQLFDASFFQGTWSYSKREGSKLLQRVNRLLQADVTVVIAV